MITICLIGVALFVALAAAVLTENNTQTADDENLVLLQADSEAFGTLGTIPVSPQLNETYGMLAAGTEQNDTIGMRTAEP